MSSDRPYPVGYGKPPIEHQFKKGASGNPKGRPRGARSVDPPRSHNRRLAALFAEMERPTVVRDSEGYAEISVFQAMIRKLHSEALKGNIRAMKLVLEQRQLAEKELMEEQLFSEKAVESYRWEWRDGRLPHSDHFRLCPVRGIADVFGPLDEDEARQWERLKARLQADEAEVIEAEKAAQSRPDDKRRRRVANSYRRLFERRLEAEVPPGWDWREPVGLTIGIEPQPGPDEP